MIMKKVFFSMAGIALVAGSALAFSTAKNEQPLPCDHPDVDKVHCNIPTTANYPEICCFEVTESGTHYYRLNDEE